MVYKPVDQHQSQHHINRKIHYFGDKKECNPLTRPSSARLWKLSILYRQQQIWFNNVRWFNIELPAPGNANEENTQNYLRATCLDWGKWNKIIQRKWNWTQRLILLNHSSDKGHEKQPNNNSRRHRSLIEQNLCRFTFMPNQDHLSHKEGSLSSLHFHFLLTFSSCPGDIALCVKRHIHEKHRSRLRRCTKAMW